MRQKKRLKFLCNLIFLMMLMLGVSIAIRANFYSQIVTWGLFAYIIMREIIDFVNEESRPDKEAEIRRQIMEKLDKAIKNIKSTV